MNYDPLYYPDNSRRYVTYGNRGMVATSQNLAAQAGLDMLKRGGNAIDAAVATAVCLTVVEPVSNGIGGDAFALVRMGDSMYGLNSSGPAPLSITGGKIKSLGYDEIPRFGWIPVTVPGAVYAWKALSERFGKLPFKELLEPAIDYAKGGFPVSANIALAWSASAETYKRELDGEFFDVWKDTFLTGSTVPKPGDMVKLPDHGKTLREIGESDGDTFYKGSVAKRIHEYSLKTGGFLTGDDLASFSPQWVEPISINYRGYDIWEIPPNGQGITALMALNILKGFEFKGRDSVDTVHKQIEAMKLAFADGKEYITDPKDMIMDVEYLLSEEYGEKRRSMIGKNAILPRPIDMKSEGTVYLAAADNDGNMVSYIQSNYGGFGSGIVIPGTGIALQNRGNCFSLDKNHHNYIMPGKRSYHTIIPGFITKDGGGVGPFGVMGGFMQPQGHVQVVMNMVDFNLNPQAALDAPRWQWIKGRKVHLESEFSDALGESLVRSGHEILLKPKSSSFGRGQIILRTEQGGYCAGTEPRADGSCASW